MCHTDVDAAACDGADASITPFLAVSGDVLIDAFVADREILVTGDLIGTPAFNDTRFDGSPVLLMDARLRTRRAATLRAFAMRRLGFVAVLTCVACPFSAEGA